MLPLGKVVFSRNFYLKMFTFEDVGKNLCQIDGSIFRDPNRA
jgi:hypothetical protein